IIAGLPRIIATTLSFRLMEMACQSSYPLNSDIASPPGTFALYLSCAAMATPATTASTTARITPIWTFIRNRLLLMFDALLPSCCGTGVWVIVFSSLVNPFSNLMHIRRDTLLGSHCAILLVDFAHVLYPSAHQVFTSAAYSSISLRCWFWLGAVMRC